MALGKSGVHISNLFNVSKSELGIRVYIGNKYVAECLPYFLENKEKIEGFIGEELLWDPNPENKDKIIALNKKFLLEDRDNWDEAIEWMSEMTIKFRRIFMDLIRTK